MIPESIQTQQLFPRAVVPRILQWLDNKQALVLVGSRQVGKTSILFLLIQHLLAQGINPNNLFYFDLENFEHLNLLDRGPDPLIGSLRLEGADFKRRIHLFLLGLRNLVVRQFGELDLRPDRGALVENFTFIHLYRELSVLDTLHFWRTKNGTEVDFVLQTPPTEAWGAPLLPIEVKYQALSRTTVPPGLGSFLATYPTAYGAVITKTTYGRITQGHTKVLFLPAWLLGTIFLAFSTPHYLSKVLL